MRKARYRFNGDINAPSPSIVHTSDSETEEEHKRRYWRSYFQNRCMLALTMGRLLNFQLWHPRVVITIASFLIPPDTVARMINPKGKERLTRAWRRKRKAAHALHSLTAAAPTHTSTPCMVNRGSTSASSSTRRTSSSSAQHTWQFQLQYTYVSPKGTKFTKGLWFSSTAPNIMEAREQADIIAEEEMVNEIPEDCVLKTHSLQCSESTLGCSSTAPWRLHCVD